MFCWLIFFSCPAKSPVLTPTFHLNKVQTDRKKRMLYGISKQDYDSFGQMGRKINFQAYECWENNISMQSSRILSFSLCGTFYFIGCFWPALQVRDVTYFRSLLLSGCSFQNLVFPPSLTPPLPDMQPAEKLPAVRDKCELTSQ